VHPRLEHDVAAPATGLHGLVDWAARARGELLVSYAALATERDKIVREATELVASVLGEPLVSTGAAGVRQRLERALGGGSADFHTRPLRLSPWQAWRHRPSSIHSSGTRRSS